MTSVVVANRGEIARRVFRTARRLGWRCLAVYSEVDAGAPHVREADASAPLGPPPGYLDVDRVVAAASELRAAYLHPGYGFLAEDAALAEACERAGIVFCGPPADVLRVAGDKVSARRVAAAAGVPILPGFDDDDGDDRALVAAARAVGFPLIVKPAGGGGGKGMSVVAGPEALPGAIESARRVASSAFGSDRLLLERHVAGARHVEVQILADSSGGVVHLFERDCTVQRRHQKVIEEAPASCVPAALVETLRASAVSLARAMSYQGAGTVEFVVGPDGQAGFLEVNARLQVEHPVTEAVTGLDLVEWQLRIAAGERLPAGLAGDAPRGHAIEARVYAEDPAAGFLPQAGRIAHLRWPDDARVDAAEHEGGEVSTHYDPMVGKVVVQGSDRGAAIAALQTALGQTEILGIASNLELLGAVARHASYRSGDVTTGWLESLQLPSRGDTPPQVVAVAAAAEAARIAESSATSVGDPWTALRGWRVSGVAPTTVVLRPGGVETVVDVHGRDVSRIGDLQVSRDRSSCHGWRAGEEAASAVFLDGAWHIWWGAAPWIVPAGPRPRFAEASGSARLEAPMPGTVVAVRVQSGDRVARGAELVVVEAMKMEHPVVAPAAGAVRAVLCQPGEKVDRGQPLVDFVADEDAAE